MMPDETNNGLELDTSAVEIIEHRGYRIRLQRTQTDWIGFVVCRSQRPTLILGTDREGLIAKARTWIEAQIKAATRD
jgi:hypothetical protein